MSDRVTAAEVEWAMSYNGYERLGRTPDDLTRVIGPARQEYERTNHVPEWCGVDLLRGWAFLMQREDYHQGGGSLGAEWASVLDAVRRHPAARRPDLPPSPPVLASDRMRELRLPETFSNRPRMHADPEFLRAKVARLGESHIAPVNSFVDQIRVERGTEFVPYVDPDLGGIAARILLVLESPAGKAALESSMLSPDNDDATAQNVWLAYEATGVPRTMALHWNVVPWYVGDGRKNAAVVSSQALEGAPYLERLADLLPDLRVVVALGKWAQLGAGVARATLLRRGVVTLDAPHPGPIPAGVTKGESLLQLHDVLRRAYELAADGMPEPLKGPTHV